MRASKARSGTRRRAESTAAPSQSDSSARAKVRFVSIPSEAVTAAIRTVLNARRRRIRNKAARGEYRRALPVGLVWGERAGEIRFHPDEAVTAAIRTVFERFAELGSVRRVWLWFRAEQLTFPLRVHYGPIHWVPPSYDAIHQVLTNPAYAGAYTYGQSQQERYVDENGVVRKRVRQLPRSEWSVLITEHHPGYIDWPTYEENLERIAGNTRPQRDAAGGAVREGSALLQGIATCGHCGRRLCTRYRGRQAAPGYHCPGKDILQGQGLYCLTIGGVQIDQAVSEALLAALQPAGLEAALRAAERIEADHDSALEQWRLAVERARYEAERAERRYRAVEPENRLVARGLETEWEQRLSELEKAQSELERRERRRPRGLSIWERAAAREAPSGSVTCSMVHLRKRSSNTLMASPSPPSSRQSGGAQRLSGRRLGSRAAPGRGGPAASRVPPRRRSRASRA